MVPKAPIVGRSHNSPRDVPKAPTVGASHKSRAHLRHGRHEIPDKPIRLSGMTGIMYVISDGSYKSIIAAGRGSYID